MRSNVAIAGICFATYFALAFGCGATSARADTMLTYVGQQLDRSGCSARCSFTHVHFTARIPGRVKPNQSVNFCGGASCASAADPVTYSDGEFKLTLKNYTWFQAEGSVTLDSTGTKVVTSTLDTSFFHESRPHVVVYGSDAQSGGDFIGGVYKKKSFNVMSAGQGRWKVSTVH